MALTIVPFLNRVNSLILNPIILLLFALSFVYFIYGVVKFLQSDVADKSAGRTEARDAIFWGIVGMLIMFSVYGIIRFVLTSFGIDPSDIPPNAQPYLHL